MWRPALHPNKLRRRRQTAASSPKGKASSDSKAIGWRSHQRHPKKVFMRCKIFSERTGLKVSELALGTGTFGQAWGYGATPEEVSRIIAGFADAGDNFIDTADNYQHGVSEIPVGEAIATNRDDFVIATRLTL